MLRHVLPALCLFAAATPAGALVEHVPEDKVIQFRVLSDGSELGHHKVRFSVDGDAVVAETDIELSAYLAFVRVFHYRHTSKEVWRGGKLSEFASTTYDDGERLAVSARLEGESFVVDGATFDGALPAGLIPTSYWNKALVEQSALFNTQTGAKLPVTITRIGPERIEALGRQVEATRYRLVSDMTLDLWYDASGQWMKSRFEARGATIEYVREPSGVREATMR